MPPNYFSNKKRHQQSTIPCSGALSRLHVLLVPFSAYVASLVRHSWCLLCLCMHVSCFFKMFFCLFSRLIGCRGFLEAAASWAPFFCFDRLCLGHAAFHFLKRPFLWPCWVIYSAWSDFGVSAAARWGPTFRVSLSGPHFFLVWFNSVSLWEFFPLRSCAFFVGWLSLCRCTADLGLLALSRSCWRRVLQGLGLNFFPEEGAWPDFVLRCLLHTRSDLHFFTAASFRRNAAQASICSDQV